LDYTLLDNLFRQIQSSEFKDLEISFQTVLSDSLEIKTRDMLVQKALIDAKSKATVIANTLNLKLGNVRQVSKHASEPIMINEAVVAKIAPPNITFAHEEQLATVFNKYRVEEIDLAESITIIFHIE
jgi:hypothetical protein